MIKKNEAQGTGSLTFYATLVLCFVVKYIVVEFVVYAVYVCIVLEVITNNCKYHE
jgi:hypothetical protein